MKQKILSILMFITVLSLYSAESSVSKSNDLAGIISNSKSTRQVSFKNEATILKEGFIANPGMPMDISTTIINESSIASVTGYYKIDGQTNWTEFPMIASKLYGKYTGTIPAQSSTISGLVKFTFKDDLIQIANNGESPEYSIRWAKELTCDFESGKPEGWISLDADGDNNGWICNGFEAHTGVGSISSASYLNYTGPLTPNNYLITSKFKIEPDSKIKFWVSAQDADYAGEHYGLGISTTGISAENFTMLFEETLMPKGPAGTWYEKSIDIPASYIGQEAYFAFRHFDCTDMFWINLDDVRFINLEPVVSIENELAPKQASLKQNYPNPFNPTTSIDFSTIFTGDVKLTVLNAKGQTVSTIFNNRLDAGNHSVNFDGSRFNSGVYFYKLETPGSTITKKMLLVK